MLTAPRQANGNLREIAREPLLPRDLSIARLAGFLKLAFSCKGISLDVSMGELLGRLA